jgi:hypothetical protein
MEELHKFTFTTDEVVALQKILGFCLFHKSNELYHVATKLDTVDTGEPDYSTVKFIKIDPDSGAVIKEYKHNNFTISIEEK